MPDRSIILFNASGHDPTGIDPSHKQWAELSTLCKIKNILVIFDMPFQGLASGDPEQDAYGVGGGIQNIRFVLFFHVTLVGTEVRGRRQQNNVHPQFLEEHVPVRREAGRPERPRRYQGRGGEVKVATEDDRARPLFQSADQRCAHRRQDPRGSRLQGRLVRICLFICN